MLSNKQLEYLAECDHRWNLKVGATGSGKSWLDYAVVIPKRLMAMKGQGSAVILGNTQGTANRNILEPMRQIYGSEVVGDIRGNNSATIFGQKVYVLGADKRTNVDRIRGMTIEYAYGDEITTWNQEVFEMLKSRLRCEHSYFDGTANPENPNHYIKKFIDSDADIYCQTSTIFDNPFLPKEFVENLCKEYQGSVYYKRFILGEWALAEGIIYDMFSHEKHIVDLSSLDDQLNQSFYISCDYGTQNATVFKKWQKGRSGVWYNTKEYYYSGREHGRQKTDQEYVEDLAKFLNGEKPKAVIVDPSAASFIEALRRAGYFVLKADNDVLNGIRTQAGLLSKGLIKYADTCTNTFKEYEGYAWDTKASEKGLDAPIKENDHCMDADRYFVNTVLGRMAIVGNKRKKGFY